MITFKLKRNYVGKFYAQKTYGWFKGVNQKRFFFTMTFSDLSDFVRVFGNGSEI